MNPKHPSEPLTGRLREARSFAVYYGSGHLNVLAQFPLVIVDAEAYTEEQLRRLQGKHTIALAYFCLAEDRAHRPTVAWYALDESGQPMRNERWDTYLVDVANPSWRQHLLGEMAKMRDQGFAGLFLDTVDSAARVDPGGEQTAALIHLLRQNWREGLFLLNRGFAVLDRIRQAVDGVLFEAFTSRQEGDGLKAWEGADLAWTESMAERLRELGLPIFTLDYAPVAGSLREACLDRARRWGFVPYVTEDLQALPQASSLPPSRVKKGPPATQRGV